MLINQEHCYRRSYLRASLLTVTALWVRKMELFQEIFHMSIKNYPANFSLNWKYQKETLKPRGWKQSKRLEMIKKKHRHFKNEFP